VALTDPAPTLSRVTARGNGRTRRGHRYDFQLIEFLRTADRLAQLKRDTSAAGSTDSADTLRSWRSRQLDPPMTRPAAPRGRRQMTDSESPQLYRMRDRALSPFPWVAPGRGNVGSSLNVAGRGWGRDGC